MSIQGLHLQVSAFLLCDAVVRDVQTGKTVIQGIFDTVFAPSFPAVHPALAAYFRIQFDGRPNIRVAASLAIDIPSGLRTISPELELVNMGPTGTTEGWINIQGLNFPEPGQYTFELLINGDPVATYRITLQQPGAPAGGHGQRQLH